MSINNITRINTIDEWRIQTNQSANSINLIETGNFNKTSGILTISGTGALAITALGTGLSVANGALFSTNVTVGKDITLGAQETSTGNLTVGAQVFIYGKDTALYVANNAIVNNNIQITKTITTNNIVANSNVNVSKTTQTSYLIVDNTGTIGTSLAVGTSATVGTTLTATGNIYGGNVTTSNTVQAGALRVDNSGTIGTTLTVTGNVAGGNLTTANSVVADNARFTNNVTVSHVVASGSFVADNARITANATFGETTATIINTTNARISANANVAHLTASESIVADNARISANATVAHIIASGSLVSDSARITANATANHFVAANSVVSDSLRVTANATANHFVAANSVVSDSARITGPATVGTTLNVTGNVAGGNLTTANMIYGGTLRTTGKTDVGGALTVAGDTSVSGKMTVTGDFVVSGTLVYSTDTLTMSTVTPVTTTGSVQFGVFRGNTTGGITGHNGLANSDANAYIRWAASSNTWQIRDVFNKDNATSYSKILTANLISSSLTSTSTDTFLSSSGAKSLKDSLDTEITDRQANVGAGIISTTNNYQANVGALRLDTVTANTNLKNYVDVANTNLKNYVDVANTNLKNYVDVANTNLKSYVDTAAYVSKISASDQTILNGLTIQKHVTLNGANNKNASVMLTVGDSTLALNTAGNLTINSANTANGGSNGIFVLYGNQTIYGNSVIGSGQASTSNTSGALQVKGGVGITGSAYVGGSAVIAGGVTIGGDLTVSGTTTTINTQNLNVADNEIILNSDWNSAMKPTEDAGILINRSALANTINTYIRWTEAGAWVVRDNTAEYKIANSTTFLAEGTNLYLTAARVRGNVSATAPISYDSGTGAFSHAASGVTATGYGDSISVPTFVVNATGHMTAAANVSIRATSTTQTGIVQLEDSTSSTSITKAATPNSVKNAYDYATTTVSTANTNMKNYVDTTVSTANTNLKNYTDTAISTANTNMKNYVDTANTNGNNYAAATVITANTNMKNYVDTTVSTANTNMKNYVDTANTNMKNYVDTKVSSGVTVSTGSLTVGSTTSSTGILDGEIRASGTITAGYSDERLKENLGNIQDAVNKVIQLNGFYYEPNQIALDMGYQPGKQVGVSAQQVQNVLPEVVVPAPVDHNYLTVHYEKLVPLLIEAIKELKAEIDELKKK